MFETAAVLSANDFSVSISSQIESDAENDFLFSAREKLDMSSSSQAARLDMIAITCNNIPKDWCWSRSFGAFWCWCFLWLMLLKSVSIDRRCSLMVKVTRVDTTNRLVVLCAPNDNNHQSILHQSNSCHHVTLQMLSWDEHELSSFDDSNSNRDKNVVVTNCIKWYKWYSKTYTGNAGSPSIARGLIYLQWRGSLTQ